MFGREAIDLANIRLQSNARFPAEERFGLTSQMRRAAVSISSNIAEGSSRASRNDFARFVEIAAGSVFELVSQAVISKRQGFVRRRRVPINLRGSQKSKAECLAGYENHCWRIESHMWSGFLSTSTLNHQPPLNQFLQQLINGLSLGSIYALIALGYTMVYGVLRFINFAHGDVYMVGAFSGYYLGRWLMRNMGMQSSILWAFLSSSERWRSARRQEY